MMNNINDFAYAIKDKNGFYYIGYNQWDKQLRKAKYIIVYFMLIKSKKIIDLLVRDYLL